MRSSIPLLIGTALAIAPVAQAQSVATGSAPTQPPTASVHEAKALHPARRSPNAKVPAARVTHAAHAAHASSAAEASGGVLALGATDITGNKELPKVMVIVPWKDSLGVGGVIKPTDSLMDDVLQPVDRGVFQRQIRYYGQIGTAVEPAAAAGVAPVGDSH